MKIALLGYGKMGKTIEQIALSRGHNIVIKSDGDKDIDINSIKKADVAIDFSIPSAAVSNISLCINNQVPVISGTTGWLEQYTDMVKLCTEKQSAFIYASNFSLGVNLFFELNRVLAKLMTPFNEYKISMDEIHHTQKLDAPSGTAISLANDIIKINPTYNEWALDSKNNNTISINAIREPDVPGTHTVTYKSEIDTIDIKHTAHNRQGFALGAVIAAEWIIGKKGVFTMKDVLNIS